MCIKYVNNNNCKNLLFIFFFYNDFTAKLDGNVFSKKELQFISNYKVLLIKPLSISTNSTKLMVLLLLIMLLPHFICFI